MTRNTWKSTETSTGTAGKQAPSEFVVADIVAGKYPANNTYVYRKLVPQT